MKVFNVKLLYVYKFISQCLPIYAFYTILFIQRGLTTGQVALLIALWSIFSIVFEVPSGILADKWNRRNMLSLAALLQGLCFVVWFFSHSFLVFAVGFVFWGISGAFCSGTEEGLIYDNLKFDGREDEFSKIYGRAQFFANVGSIVGIASAGVIASYISIGTIALISAGICFVNAFIALSLREKNYYAELTQHAHTGFFYTFTQSAAFIKRSRPALIAVAFLVFFASLGAYLDEFDALIISDLKLPSIWVSGILTVRFIFVSLGDLIAPKIQSKFAGTRRIFLINICACICLFVFALLWHQYAIIFFGVACMLMAVTEILLVDAIQSGIKEEGRSTVMSFCSMGQNVFMVCFSLLYALLTGLFTLQQAYIIFAVYGIVGGLLFVLLPNKKQR